MATEAKVIKRTTVPVSLPPDVVEKIEKLRARLGYRSRNDVISEAIKRFIEDMEETKIVYTREITLEQAKKEIAEYLKRHGSAYVSEISENLRIDVELAFKAVEDLEKEEVVGNDS